MEQIHTVAWYPMEAEKKERSALGVQTPPKSCFARDPLFLAEEGLSTEMSVNNRSFAPEACGSFSKEQWFTEGLEEVRGCFQSVWKLVRVWGLKVH